MSTPRDMLQQLADFGAIVTPTGDAYIYVGDDLNGTPADRVMSLDDLAAWINPGGGGSGAAWHAGTGTPDPGLGADGDFYLEDDGQVWEKIAGTWTDSGINLTGPQGIQGNDGEFLSTFEGAWSAGAYDEGDIVTHTGSSWLATTNTSGEPGDSGDWVLIAERGTDGAQGPPGTTDYNALDNLPTLGTAAAANVGDFATSAQGSAADTALQPGDGLADLDSAAATKLGGIAEGAEVNVQSDWDAVTGDAFIANKPTLGSAALENVEAFDAAGSAAGVAADRSIDCVWDGDAWETLGGGEVPTSAELIRVYRSTNDAEADPPTAYSVHDQWFGVSA